MTDKKPISSNSSGGSAKYRDINEQARQAEEAKQGKQNEPEKDFEISETEEDNELDGQQINKINEDKSLLSTLFAKLQDKIAKILNAIIYKLKLDGLIKKFNRLIETLSLQNLFAKKDKEKIRNEKEQLNEIKTKEKKQEREKEKNKEELKEKENEKDKKKEKEDKEKDAKEKEREKDKENKKEIEDKKLEAIKEKNALEKPEIGKILDALKDKELQLKDLQIKESQLKEALHKEHKLDKTDVDKNRDHLHHQLHAGLGDTMSLGGNILKSVIEAGQAFAGAIKGVASVATSLSSMQQSETKTFTVPLPKVNAVHVNRITGEKTYDMSLEMATLSVNQHGELHVDKVREVASAKGVSASDKDIIENHVEQEIKKQVEKNIGGGGLGM